MTEDAHQFWAFSLRFYGIPRVRDACLLLQDEAALNVNLVLWCCWKAAQGKELSHGDLRAAAGRIEEWSRTVTRPLRTLRRRVKAELGDDDMHTARHGLYERLKMAELEAERVEQALLCRAAATGSSPLAAGGARLLARSNLETYMEIADTRGNPENRQRLSAELAQLLAGADPLP